MYFLAIEVNFDYTVFLHGEQSGEISIVIRQGQVLRDGGI